MEASSIFAKLLDRQRIADPEADAPAVRDGLYVGDIQEEARQFWNDAELVEGLGSRFPAIRFNDAITVPIAFSPISPFPFRDIASPLPRFYHDLAYRFLREWEETRSDWKVTLDVGEAVETFRSGVVNFLATRIASVDRFFGQDVGYTGVPLVPLMLPPPPPRWFSQARIRTVGFTVTVHSNNPGLRIHVSASFRVNWRFFGAPSTPTVGTLTGGIYLFAADGGPYAGITPDPGTFDIPYRTVSPTLSL
jgi:hypothetical protein